MRRWWWIGLAVIAGCYAPSSEQPCTVSCNGIDSPCPGDQFCAADHRCHTAKGDCPSPIDAPSTGPPYCYGDDTVRVCFSAISDSAIQLSPGIDTDNAPDCSPHLPLLHEACVVFGRTITDAKGAVRAEGSLPLILVATETIEIDNGLDLASKVTSAHGAGGNPAECVEPSAPTVEGNGGGGAAGGSFQGLGGSGGSSNGGNRGMPSPPISSPSHLRGGCDGGLGIPGAMEAGEAGRGGGAVYLIAGSSITLAATKRINVSGSGATGGSGSGNGGGAGGMIGLSTAVFAIQGELMANGGGGSAGYATAVRSGNDSSNPTIGGLGGNDGGSGTGGNGAGGPIMPLAGGAGGAAALDANGGGGGGGAGFIVVHPSTAAAALNGVNVSPPAR